MVFFLSFFLYTNGQNIDKKKAAIKYQTILQAGLLFGESGSKAAAAFNIVNGVRRHTWFLGVGAGIDYYGEKRSVPLFIALQKDLTAKPTSLFLFVNAGHNFPLLKTDQRSFYATYSKQLGGLFYETGIGYKFTILHNLHAGFSAGYSYKQLKEKYAPSCPNCPDYTPPIEIYNYQFRRIVLKFNWWFL